MLYLYISQLICCYWHEIVIGTSADCVP